MQEPPEEFPIDAANDNAKTFEPRYSSQEDGLLSTYLHQIGKIPRLTQEEETNLFIKIEKRRLQVDELYQELVTYLSDLSLDNPPSTAILNRRIIAESFPQSTEEYLLDLVQHIKLYNAEADAAKHRIVEANLRLAVCIAKNIGSGDLIYLISFKRRALDFSKRSITLIGSVVSNLGRMLRGGCSRQLAVVLPIMGERFVLPAYLLSEIRKVNRVEASLHQQTNREPSRKEVAEASGLTVDRLLLLDQANH